MSQKLTASSLVVLFITAFAFALPHNYTYGELITHVSQNLANEQPSPRTDQCTAPQPTSSPSPVFFTPITSSSGRTQITNAVDYNGNLVCNNGSTSSNSIHITFSAVIPQGTSQLASATMQCSLDNQAFTNCSSPAAYTNLAIGTHTFQVRAVFSDGTTDTPATFTWTVTVTTASSAVNAPETTTNPASNPALSPPPNLTSSIPIVPTILQALKSKVHIILGQATTNAIKAIGTNSSAVAAILRPVQGTSSILSNSIAGTQSLTRNASASDKTLNELQTQNLARNAAIEAQAEGANSSNNPGFIVYYVFVLDSSNNIHAVIVDPGNGKVLSNQQISMRDMISLMDPTLQVHIVIGPGITTFPSNFVTPFTQAPPQS